MTDTFTCTVTLPKRVLFKNVDGEPVYFNFDELPYDATNIIGELALGGFNIVSNNTFNSGGADVPVRERLANVQKRWDAWRKGTWRITERAVSLTALMRDAYIEEQLAKHPDTSQDAITKRMSETVKDAMGKDAKATFDNFLAVVASTMAKRKGEGRSADELKALLVAKYEKAGAELEARRAKSAASVKIDLTDIDI